MKQHVLTICAAALCAAAGSASAQGAIKPIEARIVNTPSQPVPVTVVPPGTSAPTAFCRLELPSGSDVGSGPITRFWSGAPVSQIVCPTGVSRLDVHRIVLESLVPRHTVFLALGINSFGTLVVQSPIGTLSEGTPNLSLPHPVRIDVTATGAVQVFMRQVCSSGIASIPQDCEFATVYLIGTPVN